MDVRRRIVVPVVALCLGSLAACGGGTPTQVSASTSTAPVTTAAKSLSSISLPRADLFSQITVTRGRLRLGGEVASTASARTPTCVSATVDPRTVELAPTRDASCDDPTLDGETVGVVNDDIPGSNNATISIARVDPRTGHTSVGPVVMTYASYSDTRPVMTYGGGWLWIYDNSTIGSAAETVTGSNPGTAELLQVSTSSGEVVDTVSVPNLSRPIMAADDAGLWIGNSFEGGMCPGCAPPSALYVVAPGSPRAVVAIQDNTLVVCWLLGSQDHLWAGIGHAHSGCTQETIWRLDGTDFQPAFEVPDQGYDPLTVIGDESDGLWTMQWTRPPTGVSSTPSPQEIVGIDPDTGAEKVVATLPAGVVHLSEEGQGLVQGQAAVLDGSLYLLEPPFELRGYLGYSTLVKVTLP